MERVTKDERFAKLVRDTKMHFKYYGRSHLPWRQTRDPYKILVSEVMLQQTQVDRVLPKYEAFIQKFPDAKALAKATLLDVLRQWQGLGYNRRGKMLHDAAKIILANGFPRTSEEIQKLPGVGPYTARAVAVFAFASEEVFIETNIRTVFIHYCFPKKKTVSDSELLTLIGLALKRSRMQSRDFYAALMDFGSHLKKSGIKLNGRSSHYVKQSKFEGSSRQLRGQILKLLLTKPHTVAEISKESGRSATEVQKEFERMRKENLISLKRNTACIV